MNNGDETALGALHAERFSFTSLEEFFCVWRRLGDVRGEQVRADEVDRKFTDLFDIKDAAVDGAFLDFLADEVKRDVSFPDESSFGEVVRWALENRLSEAERRRIERWRTVVWGLALLVVVAAVAKFFVGTE